MRKLDPVSPVWLDKKHRQVVFQGEVCQANYPLEFLVTYPDRAYESVMVAKVKPSVVHAGLVFLGAEPGHPAQFDPKYEPATGTPVEIRVCWKDKFGQRQDCLARDWVRNIKTRKALDIDWVFGGSHLVKNPTTGKQEYLADMSGDFISVLNLGLGHPGPAAEERRGDREPQLRGLYRTAPARRHAGHSAATAEACRAEVTKTSRGLRCIRFSQECSEPRFPCRHEHDKMKLRNEGISAPAGGCGAW